MRKIINFNSFGILSIVSLVSIAGMHSLFNDVLIFYSDPYSQFVYFGAMTLLITILLSLLFSPVLCIITRLPQKAQHFIQLFSIGCILSAYVLLLINLGAYYNLQTFVRIIKPIYNNPLILLAIIAPCFVLVFVFQNSFKEIQQRLLLLGKLFSLFLIFFVPLSIIYNHISHTCVMQQCNTDNNNHLVMIVLDGWPSQYLHHYNPDAPPTVLDPLTEKGLVFNHAYTNYPYTNAYFGFLYSHDPKAGMRRSNYQDNLLSNLQNHNVQAQYIVSHRNAIPEGSAAKVNHYKGLRSYFLTTNTGWLPNILGLDYHTIVAHHMFAYRYIRNNLGQSLYYWLNTDANGEFTGHTLADFAYLIRRNQQKSGQSFTLLHTQWDSLVGNDPNIRPIFEAQDGKTIVKKLDFQRFFDQKAHEDDVVVEPEHIENIRQYDYQYPPEAAVHIQEIHEKAIHNTDVLTQQLNQLFTLINQENQHPPTILLTADHGSIYGKGRVWYTYHPNEEVVKVPLIVTNHTKTGEDNRPFDTLDLATSILDFFDIPAIDSDALSIFNKDSSHPYVITITNISNQHKEWFMVISGREEGKYVANIHYLGNGSLTLVSVTDNYEEIITPLDAMPKDIKTIIQQAIEKYSLNKQGIHPRFL